MKRYKFHFLLLRKLHYLFGFLLPQAPDAPYCLLRLAIAEKKQLIKTKITIAVAIVRFVFADEVNLFVNSGK